MDILIVRVNNGHYGINMHNVALIEQEGNKLYTIGLNGYNHDNKNITGLVSFRSMSLKVLSLERLLNINDKKFTSGISRQAIDWKVRNKPLIVCECGDIYMAFEIDEIENVICVEDFEVMNTTFDKEKLTYKIKCMSAVVCGKMVNSVEMLDTGTIIRANWN
jgi:chemotaxis signal transduction protein